MIVGADLARTAAAALLFDVLERAIDPRQQHDVITWLLARSEDSGGFLWLANRLRCRPSVIGDAVLAALETPPRARNFLRWRIDRARQKLQSGAEE